MKRNRFLALPLLLLGLEALPALAADTPPPQRVTRVTNAWPVSDFTLVDQNGKPFTQDQMKGRWTFILLGDTHCAEPCKTALRALAGTFQRIATTEIVKTTQVLFISLDPQQDTPASLRNYLAPFDSRFIGVTAAWKTLKQLVEDIGMSDSIPASPEEVRTGDHRYKGTLLLMGPDGMVRSEFLPPFDVKRLTAEYLMTRVRG
jgi:protein SCO1/2